MRNRSLARVVIVSLGVSVVMTLGCGQLPTEPTEPTPPLSASQRAALALFEAADVHMQVTTSPLTWASQEGRVIEEFPAMRAVVDLIGRDGEK